MSNLPTKAFYVQAEKEARTAMASYMKDMSYGSSSKGPQNNPVVDKYYNEIITKAQKAAALADKDPEAARKAFFG